MEQRTADNVHKAFIEEAKANERLKIFADRADREGFPQIGHLFRAVAASESVHARRHFSLLEGSVGDTDENLQRAFHAETGIAGVEYRRMLREAHEDGEKAAALFFSQARDVEEFHAKLYQKALDHVIWERETEYQLCTVCGYLADGEAPEKCPVCGARSKMFRKVEGKDRYSLRFGQLIQCK